MTIDILKQELLSVFKKELPHSWIDIKTGALSSNSIMIRFTLGGKGDWINQIWQNDAFATVMAIHDIPAGDISVSKIRIEMSMGNRVVTNRHKTPVTVVKVGWRDKSATPDNIVKHFEEYLKKIKTLVQHSADLELYIELTR